MIRGRPPASARFPFHVMFGPMLKPKGSDDLDHERDITLAIHAAIPDLTRDTNRHVIRAGYGLAAAVS